MSATARHTSVCQSDNENTITWSKTTSASPLPYATHFNPFECITNSNDVIWFDFVTTSGLPSSSLSSVEYEKAHTAPSSFILSLCLCWTRFCLRALILFVYKTKRDKRLSIRGARLVNLEILRKIIVCAAFISFYPTGAEDAAFRTEV